MAMYQGEENSSDFKDLVNGLGGAMMGLYLG